MGVFHHLFQIVPGILAADAAGHMAVLGHGIAQKVAHHGVFIAAGPVRVAGEIIVYGTKGLRAVVIVGIDDGKGAVHQAPGGQHGMAGAPGFYTAGGNGVALRQVAQLLIRVLYVDDPGQTRSDGGSEVILEFALDDEDYPLETGAQGVVDGIVDDQLAVVSHGVDLLEAAVPAAHTGGHNDQNRFGHGAHSSVN